MKGLIGGYKIGAKNNWRRWVWNRITDRLDKPISKATAIYLVGPKDIDREVAIEKGFDSRNLFAIDNRKENTQNVRNNGEIGISGNLNDILISWGNLKIDVVLADFCSNLTNSVFEFMDLIKQAPCLHCNSIIAINLQRGRESKESMKQIKQQCIESTSFPKNRAVMALSYYMIGDFAKRGNNGFVSLKYSDDDGNAIHPEFAYYRRLIYFEQWEMFKTDCLGKYLKPAIKSYRSSKNIMDSIIFINKYHKPKNMEKKENLSRSISACLAVRTMRQKGGFLTQFK